MKKILLLLIISFVFKSYGQDKLNSYEYIIIPSQYDFQKSKNQYGLNMLLKYKFQQLGFNTYLDNEDIPKELLKNECLVLTPTIVDESRMFTRNLFVEVRNCYNNVLFVTKIGSSRTKDFNKAYTEALRDALKSFGNYRLKFSEKKIISKEHKSVLNLSDNIVNSDNVEVLSLLKIKKETEFTANKSENGFLLFTNNSKGFTYKLIETSLTNTFLIKGIEGLVYKKGDFWFRDLLINDEMISDKITINF
jgi:hypothetical protein